MWVETKGNEVNKMDLLELHNNRAFPSVHALLIEPYKTIWETDTSEGKEKSIRWFSYIELLCSPKKSNPFYGYAEEQRAEKVKMEVFRDKDYPIESELLMATIAYKEHLSFSSPSYELAVAAELAANKLKHFLTNFDPNERTPNGTMVLKPKDMTLALQEIPETIRSMAEMRAKVHEELLESTRTRNDRKIGTYER